MIYYKLLILALLTIDFNYAQSQSVSATELDKLKDKSVLLIAPGVIFTFVGLTITGAGAHYLALGVEYGGTIGGPALLDARPQGRILVSIGVPLFAGGIALIASGIHFRSVYLDKKNKVTLNTGYFEDGALGIAMRF